MARRTKFSAGAAVKGVRRLVVGIEGGFPGVCVRIPDRTARMALQQPDRIVQHTDGLKGALTRQQGSALG